MLRTFQHLLLHVLTRYLRESGLHKSSLNHSFLLHGMSDKIIFLSRFLTMWQCARKSRFKPFQRAVMKKNKKQTASAEIWTCFLLLTIRLWHTFEVLERLYVIYRKIGILWSRDHSKRTSKWSSYLSSDTS